MTTAQCHALMEVGKKYEISLVELADSLGLDTSTLSRTIDGMVQAGLVERRAKPDDRRYVSISLADRGKKVFGDIARTFNDYYTAVFALIPEEKHRQVLESFMLLEEAISKSSNRQCCQEELNQ
ncbi:MAG: MarR family transcriptional regulator [Bacillota bacterium]